MRRELDIININKIARQVLFGSLLGDGCLSDEAKAKNVRYSENHCLRQKNYLF
jgi:hypothetical protein